MEEGEEHRNDGVRPSELPPTLTPSPAAPLHHFLLEIFYVYCKKSQYCRV
jgi:hypothetical protein